MRGFVVGTLATAIAFFIVAEVLPDYGLDFFAYSGELTGLIVLALIFGIVNGLIGPVVRAAALPINFMTMGLFGLIVNGVLLLGTAAAADAAGLNFTVGDFPPDLTADTVVAAVVGAIILGVINSVVHTVLPD